MTTMTAKPITQWTVAGHMHWNPHHSSGMDYQATPGAWLITLRRDNLPEGSPGPEINVAAYPTVVAVEGDTVTYSVEAQVERVIRDADGDVRGFSLIDYDERDGYATTDPSFAMDKAGWLAREYGTHLGWGWDGSREGLRP